MSEGDAGTVDKVTVGVVGCGSVSEHYLRHLRECPYAKVVAACDVKEERYRRRMEEFGIGRGFHDLDDMLDGIEFDLLLNLTSMPEHYGINKKGLIGGKHVFSEKPFARTYALGKELLELARGQRVRFWAAPTAVTSPQFRCMAEVLASGGIGKVHAAHACYGHGGPTWGPWFYKDGGGCIGDLAVYNITTLTGLLGPAKAVTALVGTAIAERTIEGEHVRVQADDNVMLLLDHGGSVFSHVQSGFVYGAHNEDRTIELVGVRGAMNLLGWDWEPKGVQVRLEGKADWETRCTDSKGYVWQNGASQVAECLVRGTKTLMTAEHALHVVEVMEAAYESAKTGHRTPVQSTFAWPLSPQ